MPLSSNSQSTREHFLSAAGTVLAASALASSPAYAATRTLKILFAAPLTGDFVEPGHDLLAGAQLATDYVNAHGGIRNGSWKGSLVELVSVDDQMSTKAGSEIGTQYLSDESFFALAGFMSSGVAGAAAQAASRGSLAVFGVLAAADYLSDKPPHNVIVLLPRAYLNGKVAAAFAIDRLKAKSIGILGGDYSYLADIYASAEDEAKRRNVSTIKQQYSTAGGSTSDFAPYLTNLFHANVDAILCGALEGDAGHLVKQARELGLRQPFIDVSGNFHQTFLAVAGRAAIGAYTAESAALTASPQTFAGQTRRQYEARFKRQMTGTAVYAFDTILSIAAIAEAGAKSRTQVLEYATKIHGHGLEGELAFGSDLRPAQRIRDMFRIDGLRASDRRVVASYRLLNSGNIEVV